MKTPSVIAALASTAASVAFQIGLANGHFRSYDWVTPYLWGAAIAFWLVFAILALKKSEASRHVAVPELSATQQQNANPVMNQTASPVMNQTVNLTVPDYRNPRAIVAAPVRGPEPQQNIKCVEARSVLIEASGDTLVIPPHGLSGFDGSIVCFRNEPLPGHRVEQPNLRAHVIYRGAEGREIADAPDGVWLGEYSAYATFTAGKKNCLLLYFMDNSRELIRVWKETYRSEHSWMGGVSYRIKIEPISETIATIDVSLLRANGTCVMQTTLDVKQTGENQLPTVTIRGV